MNYKKKTSPIFFQKGGGVLDPPLKITKETIKIFICNHDLPSLAFERVMTLHLNKLGFKILIYFLCTISPPKKKSIACVRSFYPWMPF